MKLSVAIIAVAIGQAAYTVAAPAEHFRFRYGRHRKHRHSLTPYLPKTPSSISPSNIPSLTPVPSLKVQVPIESSAAPSVTSVSDLPKSSNSPPAQSIEQPAQSVVPPAQSIEQPAQSIVPPAQSVAPPAQSIAPPAKSIVPSALPSTPSSPPSSGPSSGGKPLIDSINEYRKKANLPLFTWDSKLAANAQKTVDDNGGKTMNHELNPGSFGQVLVPGFDDADKCDKNTKTWTPFEVFFYSWMCEVPSDPALGGICPDIWDIGHISGAGGTGHHDILASSSYTKIGCAFARQPLSAVAKCDQWPGIWGCDVA